MAKRKQSKKKPAPDKHGYVSTGIYRTRVGPNLEPEKLSNEETKKVLSEWTSAFHAPAETTIREIRTELRDIMLPHLEGPFGKAPPEGRFWVIDFGDGKKGYRVKDPIGPDGGTALQRQLRDMFSALTELSVIEGLIGRPEKVGILLRSAVELGQLMERWQIRPFEELVRARRASHAALEKVNKKRKAVADKKRAQTERAIKDAKLRYPKRKDTDFIYGKAAEALSVAKSTVYRRMKKKI